MVKLISYVNILLKPYYKYITGFVLLVLFILVAKFAYDTYFVKFKKNKDFQNVANAKNTKEICAIYFFYVDWCPHCVKAKPEWQKFKVQYHNKIMNGYILKCYDIDCTKDNGDEVIQFDNTDTEVYTGENLTYNDDGTPKEQSEADTYDNTKKYQKPNQIPIQPTPIKLSTLIKKYKIDSYPTIKLTKGDLVIEFDSKITKDTLIQFVTSV
jgi:thiol-disulfide isomerase/thioredoxin